MWTKLQCWWRVSLACLLMGAVLPGWGGGEVRSTPDTDQRWSARQWHRYVAESQKAVREAYAKAAEAEEQRRAELFKNVHIRPVVKDQFGDPIYVDYGPRAYANTPCYNGPRLVGAFERTSPPNRHVKAVGLQTLKPDLPPAVPAHIDTVLKPSASHSYLQAGMRSYVGGVAPAWWRSVAGNR